mmetsp:Transcript_37263/g.100821  ORF Transcript_37263/g.100821 Transcript_37263/m.100821 type:complete len:204 (+) Transcript_37263:72-683(+)
MCAPVSSEAAVLLNELVEKSVVCFVTKMPHPAGANLGRGGLTRGENIVGRRGGEAAPQAVHRRRRGRAKTGSSRRPGAAAAAPKRSRGPESLCICTVVALALPRATQGMNLPGLCASCAASARLETSRRCGDCRTGSPPKQPHHRHRQGSRLEHPHRRRARGDGRGGAVAAHVPGLRGAGKGVELRDLPGVLAWRQLAGPDQA